jgi:hypothetical protein
LTLIPKVTFAISAIYNLKFQLRATCVNVYSIIISLSATSLMRMEIFCTIIMSTTIWSSLVAS